MSETLTIFPLLLVASILVSEMHSGGKAAVRALAGGPRNRVGAVRATGDLYASYSVRHHCKLLVLPL